MHWVCEGFKHVMLHDIYIYIYNIFCAASEAFLSRSSEAGFREGMRQTAPLRLKAWKAVNEPLNRDVVRSIFWIHGFSL